MLGISPLSFLALYLIALALAMPESVRSILLSKLNTGDLIRSEVSCDVEYCIDAKLVGLRMIMRVGQGQVE